MQVWYAERAAGIVAYVLLTALAVLGLALSNRVRTRAWPAFAIEDVHRFVGILAGVFVALHVGLIAIDTFVPFSVSQILVPFTADYRPRRDRARHRCARAARRGGDITNALRSRLSHGLWRTLHYGGFGVWGAATAHGLLTGSDRHDGWLLALYIVAVTAVLAGLTVRTRRPRPRLEAALGTGLLGAIVVVGTLALVPSSALG